MAHYRFDPFAHPAQGALHRRRAAGRVARRRRRDPGGSPGRRARPRAVEADPRRSLGTSGAGSPLVAGSAPPTPAATYWRQLEGGPRARHGGGHAPTTNGPAEPRHHDGFSTRGPPGPRRRARTRHRDGGHDPAVGRPGRDRPGQRPGRHDPDVEHPRHDGSARRDDDIDHRDHRDDRHRGRRATLDRRARPRPRSRHRRSRPRPRPPPLRRCRSPPLPRSP